MLSYELQTKLLVKPLLSVHNSVTKMEGPISMDLHICPQFSLYLISEFLYLRIPTLSLLDLL